MEPGRHRRMPDQFDERVRNFETAVFSFDVRKRNSLRRSLASPYRGRGLKVRGIMSLGRSPSSPCTGEAFLSSACYNYRTARSRNRKIFAKTFHPPVPGAHRAPLQGRRDGGEGTIPGSTLRAWHLIVLLLKFAAATHNICSWLGD